jgi:transposase
VSDLNVIGIDIAKNVLQIHGATKEGKCVFKKRSLRHEFLNNMARQPRVLVGMEACSGAHYWARELIKLGFDVKLMSPQKIKKYMEHNKNDAKDAEGCSEAVIRKNMKFVPIKTELQQDIQSLHRIRSHYVKEHTALMNMIRGLLAEYGIAIPKGEKALLETLEVLVDDSTNRLNEPNKAWLRRLQTDLFELDKQVCDYTEQVKKLAKSDPLCQRLETIKGIGPISASALVAKIGNDSEFKKGRELSAFLGLVPKQHSSGDKQMLLGITKHGDRYIRQLLIHGGRSCVKSALKKIKGSALYRNNDPYSVWIRSLVERRGYNKASVAVANKNARIALAVLKHETNFDIEKLYSLQIN